MKPRIFISSTCYDLKFVREDLADFVRVYNYEPILSENGDIGYTPGKNLDKSCYEAMQTSDMVILIIGSEYGSAATGEIKGEFAEYISITRNEFRTALDAGIPVFAMIDKKVMTEYGIYEENIEKIEKHSMNITFKITKDLNVFRFIKEIENSVTIPIQEFEKSSDIKEFIGKQWADMFKNYLVSLKEEKENRKIENSVNEMKNLIQKMDIMLDSVGKNVLLKHNPKEYEDVINKQEILGFCDALIQSFRWNKDIVGRSFSGRERFITNLLECILKLKEKDLLDNRILNDDHKMKQFFGVFYEQNLASPSVICDMYYIKEKADLLLKEHNKKAIIETMVKDEHFFKLCAS